MEIRDLLTELAEGVMTVTLNRPDKLNALQHGDEQGTHRLLPERERRWIRCVPSSSRRRSRFCAGADISAAAPRFRFGAMVTRHRIARQPIPSPGNLQLPQAQSWRRSTDLRWASASRCACRWMFGHVDSARIGFVSTSAAWPWRQALAGSCTAGRHAAGQEWGDDGELFGEEGSAEGGLVRSINPPEELLPAGPALARRFAARSSSLSPPREPPPDVEHAGRQDPSRRRHARPALASATSPPAPTHRKAFARSRRSARQPFR